MIRISKNLGKMLSLERKRKELIQSGEAKEQMQIGFWKSLRQRRKYVSNRINIPPTWSQATHIHTVFPLFSPRMACQISGPFGRGLIRRGALNRGLIKF